MADQTAEMTPQRDYWISGNLKTVATGLTGIIAIFVALKATAYSAGDIVGLDDHIFRTVAFASLTVWVALTIGLRRSGAAAIIVLGMATFKVVFVYDDGATIDAGVPLAMTVVPYPPPSVDSISSALVGQLGGEGALVRGDADGADGAGGFHFFQKFHRAVY